MINAMIAITPGDNTNTKEEKDGTNAETMYPTNYLNRVDAIIIIIIIIIIRIIRIRIRRRRISILLYLLYQMD